MNDGIYLQEGESKDSPSKTQLSEFLNEVEEKRYETPAKMKRARGRGRGGNRGGQKKVRGGAGSGRGVNSASLNSTPKNTEAELRRQMRETKMKDMTEKEKSDFEQKIIRLCNGVCGELISSYEKVECNVCSHINKALPLPPQPREGTRSQSARASSAGMFKN